MSVAPDQLLRVLDAASAALAAATAQATPDSPAPAPTINGIDITQTTIRFAVLRHADAAPVFIPGTGGVWEEPSEAWAGTVRLQVPDAETTQGPMADLVALGTPMMVYCSEGGQPFEEVWRGIIKKNPRDTSSPSMEITAYEPHSAIIDADIDVIVKKGETGQALITRICTEQAIPMGDIAGPTVPLPTAQVIRGGKLGDLFKGIFEQTAVAEGGKWLVRSHTGLLEVARYGDNQDVWHFKMGLSAGHSTLEGDITGLVTRANIMAQADDDQASSVLASQEGLSEFGVGITRIVYAEGKTTDEGATLKAKQVMATDGFPKWVRKGTAPLVMSVRRGHRVRWTDRLNDGIFIVMGVSKNFTDRTMELDLVTGEDMDRQTAAIKIEVALAAIAPTTTRKAAAGATGKVAIAHAKAAAADGTPTAWTTAGTHGGNPAVDIFANEGEPVLAPESGTMQSMSVAEGGNAGVLSGTTSGRAYYFAHCKNPMTSGKVTQGQTIGQVGRTGNAQGGAPHLHFAIASSAAVFGQLNGSGDITGDSSYWTIG